MTRVPQMPFRVQDREIRRIVALIRPAPFRDTFRHTKFSRRVTNVPNQGLSADARPARESAARDRR